MASSHYTFAPWTDVTVDDAFWSPRRQVNHRVTLQAQYQHLVDSGRLGSIQLKWKEGDPNPPHVFWDSDIAKWLEAAAYIVATEPDPVLDAQMDDVIAEYAQAQQSDGYLNVHFTVVEPNLRWANLRDWHELYCAGHLIEAAVAHFRATGKRSLLDIMLRYVDYIDSVFGPEDGKKHGYPGHQEIELALVKLYHVSGDEKHLRLARYFIDERGAQPHYYDQEAVARGDDPKAFWAKTYEYNQSHKPVREQDVAVGHSVRAAYMYTAMADLARETDDAALKLACERLYASILKRMYVTGGVGSSRQNEGFTGDYDLPNEDAYAETCASIALIFWMQRMLQLDCNSRYADTLELALYNGSISGVSLDGRNFFYVNPLAVHRDEQAEANERHTGRRQGWFSCACCPPNLARLLASLGGYVYAAGDNTAVVHLYISGSGSLQVGGQSVTLTQTGNYPWDGNVSLTVTPERPADFALKLRIPGWCHEYSLSVNGESVQAPIDQGYARISRTWQPGDTVDLVLAMPAERVYADPRVRADRGRVALQRGPLIYCLEGVDNGEDLDRVFLPRDAALQADTAPDLLGGVVVLRAEGLRAEPWPNGNPYHHEEPALHPIALTAIPYYAWENRAVGDLVVWVREGMRG